ARVAIMDQEAFPCQKAVANIGQVASDLIHPRGVGLWCDARDVDAARGQVDHEEHRESRQAAMSPDVDREEIRRRQDLPLRFEELGEGCTNSDPSFTDWAAKNEFDQPSA